MLWHLYVWCFASHSAMFGLLLAIVPGSWICFYQVQGTKIKDFLSAFLTLYIHGGGWGLNRGKTYTILFVVLRLDHLYFGTGRASFSFPIHGHLAWGILWCFWKFCSISEFSKCWLILTLARKPSDSFWTATISIISLSTKYFHQGLSFVLTCLSTVSWPFPVFFINWKIITNYL